MILFSYNFKHKKTSDFIFHSLVNKIKIDLIIAENKKNLNIKSNPFRTKVKNYPLLHPKDISDCFGIPYIVADHNSHETIKYLKELKPKIGMISGARILSKEIINNFNIGIINFHPGDIPQIRGLNSVLKSIRLNKKIVVTSHLIDKNIDSGYLIEKQSIDVEQDDTLFDISAKSYSTQLRMMKSSYLKAINKKFSKIDLANFPYDSSLPFESLTHFEEIFANYKKNI